MEEKNALVEMGLTENEAEIYLILVRSGALMASQIAEKTRIHRVNVYSLLERLEEKGLVSSSLSGKRKYFQATLPDKLLALEDERRKHIEETVNKLNSQLNISTNTQEAIIYKDKKGIKAVLSEVIHSKTDVIIFASGWGFEKNFPEYYELWHKQLVQNKIRGRMLLSEHFRNIHVLKPWNVKFLPADFILPSTTLVFEDKMLLNLWGTPPLAILIKSKEAAESYKHYFELLWKQAKT